MRFSGQRGLAAYLVVTTALGAVACGDRTLQQYRDSEAQKQREKLQAGSGTFRGLWFAQSDPSKVISGIEVTLSPELSVGSSGDQITTETRVGLRADVRLTGSRNATMTFVKGAYVASSAEGDASAQVQFTQIVQLANGGSAQLELRGTLKGNVLTGVIESSAGRGAGGAFSLVKDDAGQAASAIEKGRLIDDPVFAEELNYRGSPKQAGSAEMSIGLQLLRYRATAEQEFAEVVHPTRLLSATLAFPGTSNVPVNVTFEKVIWDRNLRTLNGTKTIVFGGDTGYLQLSCVARNFKTGAGWDCRYDSTLSGVSYSIDFEPLAEEKQP